MSSIAINVATEGDVETLSSTGRRLFVQAYGAISDAEDLAVHLEENFGVEAVAAELGKPGVHYFMATDSDIVAGFMKLRHSDIPDAVPASAATEVQQLYVDADQQRKGIGRQLMDQAVAVAGRRGDEGIWLSVWQEADWAVRFYEAYGFRSVGIADFRLGRSNFTDHLMWLSVDTA